MLFVDFSSAVNTFTSMNVQNFGLRAEVQLTANGYWTSSQIDQIVYRIKKKCTITIDLNTFPLKGFIDLINLLIEVGTVQYTFSVIMTLQIKVVKGGESEPASQLRAVMGWLLYKRHK